MKPFLFLSLSLLLFFPACARQKQARYKEDPSPKFANSRSFLESTDLVKRAAKQVLESLSQQSDPPTTGSIYEENSLLRTGWVYAISKDKYVLYDFNGVPKRKPLAVRRKYAYVITPSLSGSQVTLQVEEEIQQVDLKSGQSKGWKNAAPNQEIYDLLIRKLREKIREL